MIVLYKRIAPIGQNQTLEPRAVLRVSALFGNFRVWSYIYVCLSTICQTYLYEKIIHPPDAETLFLQTQHPLKPFHCCQYGTILLRVFKITGAAFHPSVGAEEFNG